MSPSPQPILARPLPAEPARINDPRRMELSPAQNRVLGWMYVLSLSIVMLGLAIAVSWIVVNAAYNGFGVN